MGSHHGIVGDLSFEPAISQDERRQDGKDRFALRPLKPPDHQTTKPNTGRVGMARQSISPRAPRVMLELEANGQDKGDHQINAGFALPQHVHVGSLIVKIDDNSTVLSAAVSLLLRQGMSSSEGTCPGAMPMEIASFSSGVGHNVTGQLAQAGTHSIRCRNDMASGSEIGFVCRSTDVETVPRVPVPCPFLSPVQTAVLEMLGITTKFGGI
jgi:hypothetical protein